VEGAARARWRCIGHHIQASIRNAGQRELDFVPAVTGFDTSITASLVQASGLHSYVRSIRDPPRRQIDHSSFLSGHQQAGRAVQRRQLPSSPMLPFAASHAGPGTRTRHDFAPCSEAEGLIGDAGGHGTAAVLRAVQTWLLGSTALCEARTPGQGPCIRCHSRCSQRTHIYASVFHAKGVY